MVTVTSLRVIAVADEEVIGEIGDAMDYVLNWLDSINTEHTRALIDIEYNEKELPNES